MNTKTTVKKAIFMVFVSIILWGVVMEIAVRYFVSNSVMEQLHSLRGMSKLRPSVPFLLNTENAKNQHTTTEFDVKYKINSFGFRDDYIQKDKVPRQKRILFIGPSWVFGWGVERRHAVPEVVERHIRMRFPQDKIEVINAGVPSQWILQNVIYYIFMLHEFQPDLIVHMQAEDITFQAAIDMGRMLGERKEILSPDGKFQKIYQELSGVPIIGKLHLVYFILETLRNSSFGRNLVNTLIPTRNKAGESEGTLKIYIDSNAYDPIFSLTLTKILALYERLGVKDLEEINESLLLGGDPLSEEFLNTGEFPPEKLDLETVGQVSQILREFEIALSKSGIGYLFCNFGGHPYLEGDAARKKAYIMRASESALDMAQVSAIHFNQFLFQEKGYQWGSSNVKKLFYPKDRHPNKSGYKELADFIWRELLKRNELGAG